MSGDLQATLAFSVELLTFHNVDLFQRGYYQIQCTLKPPAKAAANVVADVWHESGRRSEDYLISAEISPSGTTAISKTFQILYKNEEVLLEDCFVFNLNMLVDSEKIVDQIDQADIQLVVELFFSDSESGPCSESLMPVVSQTIKLHMSCVKGFHHHVPLLFDYYHFAVIDINIHGTLLGLSLPDPSIIRVEPKKSWLAKSASNTRVSTPPFYVTLFSNKALSQSSKTTIVERQLSFAYDTHRSLCSTLLSAQVNLLAYFQCLSEFLPENQRIDLGIVDFGERLEEFSSAVEEMSSCDETFAKICSNFISISSELELAWSQFLEFFCFNKNILPFLRKEHYQQRVAHLSEAFFVLENPWEALQNLTEQSFQQHQSLSQSIKGSKYYQTIPPVQLECPALDGDNTTIPIIFEDRFSSTFDQGSDFSRTEIEEISFMLDSEDGQEGMVHTNGVDEGYLNVSIISDSVDESLDENSKECLPSTDVSKVDEAENSAEGPDELGDMSQDGVTDTNHKADNSSSGITETEKEAADIEDVEVSLDGAKDLPIRDIGEDEKEQQSDTTESIDPKVLEDSKEDVSEEDGKTASDLTESKKEEEQCDRIGTVSDGTGAALNSDHADREEVEEVTPDAGENAKECETVHAPDVVDQEQSSDAGEHIETSAAGASSLSAEGAPQQNEETPELSGLEGEVNPEDVENSTGSQKRPDSDDAEVDTSKEISEKGDPEAAKGGNSEESEGLKDDGVESRDSTMPCTDLENPARDDVDGPKETNLTPTEDTNQHEQVKTEVQSSSSEAISSITVDSQSHSSEYETATSSEALPTASDRTPKSVAYRDDYPQPVENVNGITVVDSTPGASKKSKKKSNKVVSASIYACFPMGCAGDVSPSLGLCRMDSVYGGGASSSRFEIAKRLVKRSLNFSYRIYSDIPWLRDREPYFTAKPPETMETHLIVCVHGLDGNSGDLRLLRCYLEMALPSTRLDFLMSEINQSDTFAGFEAMTTNLVQEIIHHIEAYTLYPTKLSFIGHSLGNLIIRSALGHPDMEPFLDKMHTFLSLSGPHLGMLFQTSSLVSTGLWLMQKWKKSDSLSQLTLHDNPDLRQTFIYRLSQSQGLCHFKNVLLVSSVQDHYVPYHSARMEMCRAALKESSELAVVYREMVNNLLSPLKDKTDMNFVRYSVYHAIPNSANSLIGRAAHIAMLDSELFIEKLLLVSALEYFR